MMAIISVKVREII